VPAAYTAFALAPGAPAPEPVARPIVRQGALEGSNANPIDEMVSMITTLRGFEASQRVLRSIDENLDRLNQTASR
jgi:flagellar basal body rod protein FlgG